MVNKFIYMGIIYLDTEDRYKVEIKKNKISKINRFKNIVYTDKPFIISGRSTRLFTEKELNKGFNIFTNIKVYYSLDERLVEKWLYEQIEEIRISIIKKYQDLSNMKIIKKY